jgi:acyl carrier protein
VNTADAHTIISSAIREIAPDVDPDAIGGDENIFEALELDSMDLLNVVTVIHERHGIEIPERDYGKLTTLDDFSSYLVGLSGGEPPAE